MRFYDVYSTLAVLSRFSTELRHVRCIFKSLLIEMRLDNRQERRYDHACYWVSLDGVYCGIYFFQFVRESVNSG